MWLCIKTYVETIHAPLNALLNLHLRNWTTFCSTDNRQIHSTKNTTSNSQPVLGRSNMAMSVVIKNWMKTFSHLFETFAQHWATDQLTYRLSMPERHVPDIGEQISSNPARPSSIFPQKYDSTNESKTRPCISKLPNLCHNIWVSNLCVMSVWYCYHYSSSDRWRITVNGWFHCSKTWWLDNRT